MGNPSSESAQAEIEIMFWPGPPDKPTVLFLPGMLGSAPLYQREIEQDWKDYSCIAMTFRGRGRRPAPPSGFSLSDHASDLNAVIKHCSLKNLYVVAHSRSVSYLLGWFKYFSQSQNVNIIGVAFLDHPPFHFPISDEWVKNVTSTAQDRNISLKTLQNIKSEAQFEDLTGIAMAIQCPTLWVTGTETDCMLTEEDVRTYASHSIVGSFHIERGMGHEWGPKRLRVLLSSLIA